MISSRRSCRGYHQGIVPDVAEHDGVDELADAALGSGVALDLELVSPGSRLGGDGSRPATVVVATGGRRQRGRRIVLNTG